MDKMFRKDFELLDDMSLLTACFDPLLDAFKQGRLRGEEDAAFYADLNEGQRLLFIFRVYYDHVIHSTEELYWWSAYFMAQPLKWSAVKSSFRTLGGAEAEELLNAVEKELDQRDYVLRLESFHVLRSDLEKDQGLKQSFASIYDRLQPVTSKVIHGAAEYIRRHPEQFIPID